MTNINKIIDDWVIKEFIGIEDDKLQKLKESLAKAIEDEIKSLKFAYFVSIDGLVDGEKNHELTDCLDKLLIDFSKELTRELIGSNHSQDVNVERLGNDAMFISPKKNNHSSEGQSFSKEALKQTSQKHNNKAASPNLKGCGKILLEENFGMDATYTLKCGEKGVVGHGNYELQLCPECRAKEAGKVDFIGQKLCQSCGHLESLHDENGCWEVEVQDKKMIACLCKEFKEAGK